MTSLPATAAHTGEDRDASSDDDVDADARTDPCDEARRVYVGALAMQLQKYEALQNALLVGAGGLIALKVHLERGGNARDFMEYILPGDVRSMVVAALTEWERARHDCSGLLYRLLHTEGLSNAEIGRLFGVSRQLVSRVLNETA